MSWMFKEDDYTPTAGKDAFVDKSILSFIKVLSRIQRSSGKPGNSFVYRVNPALKLISVLITVLLVSLSNSPLFVALAVFLGLMGFTFLDGESRKKAGAICMFALMLTFVMLIPSILYGNIRNSLMLILKVACNVSLLYVFSYTTGWHDVTKTLKLLFVPDLFILILDISIRYIFLLGEMSLEMLYALKTRSIGANKEKFATVSRVMGNLFIKSAEAGSEMYYAMECRGYTGDYTAKADRRMCLADLVYGTVLVIMIVIFFLVRRK